MSKDDHNPQIRYSSKGGTSNVRSHFYYNHHPFFEAMEVSRTYSSLIHAAGSKKKEGVKQQRVDLLFRRTHDGISNNKN